MVANATGCSSIYGGNLPTTPWAKNNEGRGPAWSNSLFEDNAEFGLGMRLTLDKQGEYVRELLPQLAGSVGESLVDELLDADQTSEAGHQPAARARGGSEAAPEEHQRPTGARSAQPGGCAGAQERVDHRRRRLGV